MTPKSDFLTPQSHFAVTFGVKKSLLGGHLEGYFGGDPESHFLVTFELLLIFRSFGGSRGVRLFSRLMFRFQN